MLQGKLPAFCLALCPLQAMTAEGLGWWCPIFWSQALPGSTPPLRMPQALSFLTPTTCVSFRPVAFLWSQFSHLQNGNNVLPKFGLGMK